MSIDPKACRIVLLCAPCYNTPAELALAPNLMGSPWGSVVLLAGDGAHASDATCQLIAVTYAHGQRVKEVVMEIAHKRMNRVDLLKLSGRLDAASAPQLRQKLDELFNSGRYRIVLDLADLDYIASPGLRVLIEARKRARDWKFTDLEGGDVRIATLTPRIKEVFDLTGFTSLFEIYPDTLEAVGSF